MPAVCPLLVLGVVFVDGKKSGAFRKSVFQNLRYVSVYCLTSPQNFDFERLCLVHLESLPLHFVSS